MSALEDVSKQSHPSPAVPEKDTLIALRDALNHMLDYSCVAAMGGNEAGIKDEFFKATEKLSPQHQYELYTELMDIVFHDSTKPACALGPSQATIQERAVHFCGEFEHVFNELPKDKSRAERIIPILERALNEVNQLLGEEDTAELEIDDSLMQKLVHAL